MFTTSLTPAQHKLIHDALALVMMNENDALPDEVSDILHRKDMPMNERIDALLRLIKEHAQLVALFERFKI
jgi:hypothetical protein